MKRYVILALLTAVLLAGCTPAPEATENQESSLPPAENSAQISENPENEQQTGDEVWQKKDGNRVFQYRKTPDGYLFTLETVYHDDECEKVMAIFSYLTKDGKNLFRQHEAYDEEGGLIERNYYSFDDDGNEVETVRTNLHKSYTQVMVFRNEQLCESHITKDGQIIYTRALSDDGVTTENYYMGGKLYYCEKTQPDISENGDFFGADLYTTYNSDMKVIRISGFCKCEYILEDGRTVGLRYDEPSDEDQYQEIYENGKLVASCLVDSDGNITKFESIADGYSEAYAKKIRKEYLQKDEEINSYCDKWYEFRDSE